MSRKQYLDDFLNSLSSPNTRLAYAAKLKDALELSGVADPRDFFSEDNASKVYRMIGASKMSLASKNLSLAACRAWGRFLCDSGVLRVSGFAALPYFKLSASNPVQPGSLSMDQLRRFAAALDGLRGRTAARDALMCKLIYSSGLKVSEVTSLRVPDVCLKRATLRLSHGEVPVYPDLLEQLRDYLAVHRLKLLENRKSDVLFPSTSGARLSRASVFRRIQKAGKACGLKVSAAVLRNSFARIAFAQGVNLAALSRVLGHRNLQTTARIAGASVNEPAVEHRCYHPRNL